MTKADLVRSAVVSLGWKLGMTKADLVRSAVVSLGWKLGTTRGTEPEPTTTIVPVFRMPPASGAGDGVPLAPDLAVPSAPPQSQTSSTSGESPMAAPGA